VCLSVVLCVGGDFFSFFAIGIALGRRQVAPLKLPHHNFPTTEEQDIKFAQKPNRAPDYLRFNNYDYGIAAKHHHIRDKQITN